ncbi:MAG: NAD+ synthase [Spirochaetes bacterium]|nr:NAD+ synthase [Spirochaetota bacterium]
MKIAISQINTIVGDFSGNREKILEYTNRALNNGADVVVFPELALCGYPLHDLLDQDIFYEKTNESLNWLQENIPDNIAVLVGHVSKNIHHNTQGQKKYNNSVSVILRQEIVFSQAKETLPLYDVFDETRYFQPATSRNIFEFKGLKIGIAICEDATWTLHPARRHGCRDFARGATTWTLHPARRHGCRDFACGATTGTQHPELGSNNQKQHENNPITELAEKGAQLIIAPCAAPFSAGKQKAKFEAIREISKKNSVPVIYVNLIGGNDSLIFDGNSMVIDEHGELILAAKDFEEDIIFYDTDQKYQTIEFKEDYYNDIEKALILGLRDYLAKCGFKKVHLGLSGGLDSAIVTYLAVKAIGSENVKVFALPSEFSPPGSITDAQKLADNLGLKLETIPIKNLYEQFLSHLEPFFKDTPFGLAEESLQARIRGTLMMAYSNKHHSLLLATGNKSELSVGYCTLYGDMAGGLDIIGDLFKTDIFKLCRHINKRDGEIIPESIISKPPSAELRPDQKDEDSLPPYDILDKILELYIEENLSKEEIIKKGYDEKTVSFVISLVAKAEFKRVQAPVILKISPRAFGPARRAPFARKIYED